jgi:SAM-dependent methyltransferase
MFKTTEITAYSIPSDNVIHQRLLFAYEKSAEYVHGDVLEVGCGVGKGAELFADRCKTYTALDKNTKLIEFLSKKHPKFRFIDAFIPPFAGVINESADVVVTQQVIEHIEDDNFFLKEIARVLKSGGKAVITTPNKDLSLTRNPWHVREYRPDEFLNLLRRHFSKVALKGVTGNQKVWDYYERNKASVAKITRFDIFDFQHRLPRQILQIPYDILNRLNRKKLKEGNNELVSAVTTADYWLSDDLDKCFDFFAVVEK